MYVLWHQGGYMFISNVKPKPKPKLLQLMADTLNLSYGA